VNVVVVDIEATCWSDDQPELRQRQRAVSEIIEIGAVRLVGPRLEPDGEYQAFVRPVNHSVLSDFCCQLTSISQDDVKDAPEYPEAWRRFLEWTGPTDVLQMVSWSAYDHHLFCRQCGEADVDLPKWKHVDIKAEFGRWVFSAQGLRGRFRFSDALAHVEIEALGTAHRAIADARNTATLLRHIRDPHHSSALAKHALRLLRDRSPSPTHLGHLRQVVPLTKRWFPRIRHELIRSGLVEDMGQGRGLTLTPYGTEVVADLDLDALPAPVDPEKHRLTSLSEG
jgi:inhibitor of KinA sporulation pathway (predicted exonuclease)